MNLRRMRDALCMTVGLGGLVLALGAAVRVPTVTADAAAVVNGVAVFAPPGDDARRLDHAIDRELLIQRGLETGLPRLDRRVRGLLVRAQVDAVVADGAVAGGTRSAEEVLAAWLRDSARRTPIRAAPDVRQTWRAGTYGGLHEH